MRTVIIFLSFLLCSSLIHAQNNPTTAGGTSQGCFPYPKTIWVTGSAEMEVVPDEIYVQVDLREYKKKGEEKTQLEKIQADFLAACKTAGIPDADISVSSYGGYNMGSLWQRRKRDPDLMASVSYQIKFSNTRSIDALIDLLDDQATSNFSITRVSHSKIMDFRRQLKIQAIKAAKEKGIALTDAINERLGEAVTIVEPDDNIAALSSYSNIGNAAYMAASQKQEYFKDMAVIQKPDVDYRKIKLRYEVSVLFALK